MLRRQALLLLALVAAFPAAYAQAEKSRATVVRIVVPFAAGGGVDVFARMLAGPLSEELGQPFIVENRVGAGGTIAAEHVARSAPDGHTLLIVPASYASSSNPALYRVPYDPVKGIAPIALLATLPLVAVVPPSVPANSLTELIALARSSPGKLSFGSGGSGATLHMSAELFRQMAGIDMVHVPYKGAAAAIPDLLSGRIQLMFIDLGTGGVITHIRSGKLRALGVTTEKRSPTLPDVPSIGEVVPGYAVTSWFGMWAAAGTPREIIMRYNEVLGRILKRPDIQLRMRADAIEPAHSTPEEFGRLIERDIALWAKVAKAGNLKID